MEELKPAMAPDVKKHTTGYSSRVFYFDVGGVLIEDKFGKDARMVLRDLAERYGGDPKIAYTVYVELQPSLDDGRATLADFCNAARFDQQTFEREWIAMHPVYAEVLSMLEELLKEGERVGLATNFCKQLLELLIFHNPVLAGLSLCCSSEVGFVKPSEEFFRRAAEIMPLNF